MNKSDFKIVTFIPKKDKDKDEWDFTPQETRFCIINNDGEIVDDAQGYGYKTSQNAHIALNYKFLGGNKKKAESLNKYKSWRKENTLHNTIILKFKKIFEINIKEISRGEVTEQEIWKELEEDYSIEIPDFVKKNILNK